MCNIMRQPYLVLPAKGGGAGKAFGGTKKKPTVGR